MPTSYALYYAITPKESEDFIAVSREAATTLDHYIPSGATSGDPRVEVTEYVRRREPTDNTLLALRQLVNEIGDEVALFKGLAHVLADRVPSLRNEMYLASEALRLMQKTGQPVFSEADAAALANYKRHVDRATRFIPVWGKVAVALALGCGTIVGWKRIVVTVGEKIGAHDAGGHDAVGRPLLGLPVNILRGGGHGRMLPIAPGRRIRG